MCDSNAFRSLRGVFLRGVVDSIHNYLKKVLVFDHLFMFSYT